MTIESATNVYGLNTTLPADGDEQAEGDDHIRMIKAVIKNTFPGLGGALGRTSSKNIGFTPGLTENTCVFHCTASVTMGLLAVAGVPDGTHYFVNAFGGAVTVDPNGSELVNGAATFVYPQGYWGLVVKVGSGWNALCVPTPEQAITAATAKATPVDADTFGYTDSAASFSLKKLTWANTKTTLKTYFDTLYLGLVAPGTSGNVLTSNGSAWTSSALVIPSGIPAGCVAHFAMSSAPTGWLKANGAAVSRATYSALFSAIGTTFGAGNGSTTFTLPDLRGEFLRGLDDARGVDSGRVLGTAQGATSIADGRGSGNLSFKETDGTDGTKAGFYVQAAGAGTETFYKTRPRNIALLACIKY